MRTPALLTVERLHAWLREAPRPWETQAQFIRRIHLVGEEFPHALAQRWIEEELAAAAILWTPGLDEASFELSDLRVAAVQCAGDAYRRMERAGGGAHGGGGALLQERARFRDPRDVARDGDSLALRLAATAHEWHGDYTAAADLFVEVERWDAAEHMLVLALAAHLGEEATDLSGMRAERAVLRERLRDAMERAG